ncbi:MAG: M56 family metallopeptidase [Kordiimonadaceae bacterium]|nr:M56 family metallopeptidase [Kordiimonadaceae bacterium]
MKLFLQLFSGLYAKDFVALGWIALAALTLFALLLSYRDAVNSLGSRQRVGAEEKASKTLRAICEKADIRHVPYLSRSSDIKSPVCLPYREICLPDWAFETMPEAEFKSLLAHELGHMVRRDPVMLMVLRALSRIFFFQPLFILARRRLTDIAELAADEWAAKQVTNSRAVANALYFCATKIQETRQIEWGLAMAGNKSILKRRVERLVDAQHTPFKAASAFSKTVIAVGALALSLGLPSIEFAHAKVTAEPAQAAEPPTKAMAPNPKRTVVIERTIIRDSKASMAPNAPVAPVAGTQGIDEHEMEVIVREALEKARAEIDGTAIDKMVLDALRDAGVHMDEKEISIIVREAKADASAEIDGQNIDVIVRDAMVEARSAVAETRAALAEVSKIMGDHKIEIIVSQALEHAEIATAAALDNDYIQATIASALASTNLVVEPLHHGGAMGQHGDASGTLTWRDGKVKLSVVWDGAFRISDDGTTVIAEGNHGFLRIKTRNGTEKRVIKFEVAEGKAVRTYKKNSKKIALDADGKKWLTKTLSKMVEIGFGARNSVERLIKKKGLKAVFSKAKTFESDRVKRIYVMHAIDLAELKASDIKRAIDVVNTMDNDFEKRVTLSHLLEAEKVSDKMLPLVLAVAQKMDSDYEKSLLAIHYISKFELTNRTVGPLMKIGKSIESDFELRRLLTAALSNAKISDKNAGKLFDLAVEKIESDYELRLLLSSMVHQVGASDAIVAKALKGLQKIESDYESRLLLATLVASDKLSEENWLVAIQEAASINSNYDKALILGQMKEALPDGNEKVAAALKKAMVGVEHLGMADDEDRRERQRERAEEKRELAAELREAKREAAEAIREALETVREAKQSRHSSHRSEEEEIALALWGLEREIAQIRRKQLKASGVQKAVLATMLKEFEQAKHELQAQKQSNKKYPDGTPKPRKVKVITVQNRVEI